MIAVFASVNNSQCLLCGNRLTPSPAQHKKTMIFLSKICDRFLTRTIDRRDRNCVAELYHYNYCHVTEIML